MMDAVVSTLDNALRTRGYRLRVLTAADLADRRLSRSLLDLINKDRLLGQPLVGREGLAEALAGRSPIDGGFWRNLAQLRTLAAENDGELVAVFALGRRADGVFTLPWLHASEQAPLIEAILDAVIAAIAGARLEACAFASALSFGLEGLPVRHRPVTHQALLTKGFSGTDCWLYLRASELPSQAVEVAEVSDEAVAVVAGNPSVGAWSLKQELNGELVAKASVELAGEQRGIVWWLEVAAAARGVGHGRAIFRQALALLQNRGAQEVLLFVDHDDPVERNRAAAVALYLSEGFEVIDHLWSYELDGSIGSR